MRPVTSSRHRAGAGVDEAADVLGISLTTAKRDFRLARAWLTQRLQRPAGDD